MADSNTTPSIFSKIAKNLPTNIAANAVTAAKNWFKTQMLKLADINPNQLFSQEGEKHLVNEINVSSIGSMFMYFYDPKLKDILPYYDTFPVIFVIEIYKDGFLGINLHYLPPYYRAKLMDALYDTALKQKDMMKLRISYQILKGASKYKLFKPCIKRYLKSHVASRYFFIEPDKWDIVLQLPLQRFVKSDSENVWKKSLDSVGNF